MRRMRPKPASRLRRREFQAGGARRVMMDWLRAWGPGGNWLGRRCSGHGPSHATLCTLDCSMDGYRSECPYEQVSSRYVIVDTQEARALPLCPARQCPPSPAGMGPGGPSELGARLLVTDKCPQKTPLECHPRAPRRWCPLTSTPHSASVPTPTA
eukprot:7335774-Prymnesium_polylepis.1